MSSPSPDNTQELPEPLPGGSNTSQKVRRGSTAPIEESLLSRVKACPMANGKSGSVGMKN